MDRKRGQLHDRRGAEEAHLGARISGRDERPIAVMGVQDEAKGEALVLLSAVDVDLAELREKLRDAGVPNLWIPKHIQRVEAIPVLASGKLDLKKCQELAVEP